MTERERFALKNAAASSAMEDMPLTEEQLMIAQSILNEEMTLEMYFRMLQMRQQGK